MASPVFQNYTTLPFASVQNRSVTKPNMANGSAAPVGSLIVLQVTTSSAAGDYPTQPDMSSYGWLSYTSAYGGGAYHSSNQYIYYRFIQAGDASSYTVNFGSTIFNSVGAILISNVDNITPFMGSNNTANTNFSTSSLAIPTIDPSRGEGLYLSFVSGVYNPTKVAPPSGVTEIWDMVGEVNSVDIVSGAGYETLNNTGDPTGTRTWTINGAWSKTAYGLVIAPPSGTQTNKEISISTTPNLFINKHIPLGLNRFTVSNSSTTLINKGIKLNKTLTSTSTTTATKRSFLYKILLNSSLFSLTKKININKLFNNNSSLLSNKNIPLIKTLSTTSITSIKKNIHLPKIFSTVQSLLTIRSFSLLKYFSTVQNTKLNRKVFKTLNFVNSQILDIIKLYGSVVQKIFNITSNNQFSLTRFVYKNIVFSQLNQFRLVKSTSKIIKLLQSNNIGVLRSISKILSYSSAQNTALNKQYLLNKMFHIVTLGELKLFRRIAYTFSYYSNSSLSESITKNLSKIIQVLSNQELSIKRSLSKNLFIFSTSDVNFVKTIALIIQKVLSIVEPHNLTINKSVGKSFPLFSTSQVYLLRKINKLIRMINSNRLLIKLGDSYIIDIIIESTSSIFNQKNTKFIKNINFSSVDRIVDPVFLFSKMLKLINKIGV